MVKMADYEDDRQRAIAIGSQIRLVRKKQGLSLQEVAGRILAVGGEEEPAPSKIKAAINRLARIERGERLLKVSYWKELKSVLPMTEEEEEACMSAAPPHLAHDEGRRPLLLDRELLESVVSHMEKELHLSRIDSREAVERLCKLYVNG